MPEEFFTQSSAITPCCLEKYANLQYADAEEIAAVREKLLRQQLAYAARNSPFYRRIFQDAGLDAARISLEQIPPTTKDMLSGANKEFLAVPETEVADICLTSASVGTIPTQIYQTASDLARLAYNEQLAFTMAGVTNTDTLMVCAALDRCFMAGLAYWLGGVKCSAKVVRAGAGDPAQQWHLLKTLNATVLVGVPSLLLKIARYAVESGEDPADTAVTRLIVIGEPVRDAELQPTPLAAKLENIWNAKIYSTYASSEMATAFCECEARQGGHVRPELILVEILDENGCPVATGKAGEVTVTPLGIQGMPLLRFRTGDIAFMIGEPCSCGRTTPRLGPVLGRKQQMLKFKGTTIFPNTILAALEGADYFYSGMVEAVTGSDGTDHVILYAAVTSPRFDSSFLADELRAKLRVVPEIVLLSVAELDARIHPENRRKRLTFLDSRD